ncbi:MAG: flagellar hook-associated protein FlgK [Campylobacteraceae bacterium]|nr:flagellar hook-associated protein FlgK [Campylobacteraceae bacterium]
MLSSLGTALSGLNAARISVENISNNIANENTPGYKKRTVQMNEMNSLDSIIAGQGVNIGGINRVVSQYMYDNIMAENAKKNYHSTMDNMLADIESVFKETDNSGFTSDFNRYFQAVENLRSNPNSQIYKTDLKNQGTIIVDTLNRLYDGIEAQEKLSENSLERDVTRVNELLEEMGKINKQIVEQEIASNALLDRRDLLEMELGTYVDIEVDRSSYGYELRIGGSVALRYGDNARTFSVLQESVAQKDVYLKDDGQTSSLEFSEPAGDPTFDENDIIRYKFNNDIEVSLQFGEHVDMNNDGIVDAGETANNTNYLRLLTHKINNTEELKDTITAYNGTYKVDADGNKTTNDSKDNYLLIEADVGGPEGRFDGRIVIEEYDDTPLDVTNLEAKNTVYQDEYQSKIGSITIDIQLFDRSINVTSGSIKAYVDNLQTESGANKFQEYKDQLDQFAKTLGDMTSQYIKNDDGTYLYGEMSIDGNVNPDGSLVTKDAFYIGNITSNDPTPDGLFSGSDVRSMRFNEGIVDYLDQDKLDYLSKLQWKDDISFKDGSQGTLTQAGILEDPTATSFTAFFQKLTLDVSSDKESNAFLLETQKTVIFSLEESYNQIVKVDKDEELLDLIKYQAAYAANAKVITALDEMIQVLLGIKR